MSQTGSRRMGGRQARRQVRAMALPENLNPVRAGQESGRYLPLQENELDLIHEQVIRVLEKIGLADAIPSCIEVMTAQGCTMTESGRLLIPRKVVEEYSRLFSYQVAVFFSGFQILLFRTIQSLIALRP